MKKLIMDTLKKITIPACLILLALSIFTLAWVQWQGVKAERNKVVVEMLSREQVFAVLSAQLFISGFSIEEVLEHLYSVQYPYKEMESLIK